MLLIFVHGWSVTDTAAYAKLPEALVKQGSAQGLDIEIQHIWLGKYISFHDEVRLSDVARAFDQALREQIPRGQAGIQEFSCITHSTGGPVVREWMHRFYGPRRLKSCPLRHLVMLAPANHGSALAKLGKKKVGRIKAWFEGVEPGQRVLDWLSLGSLQQMELAREHLAFEMAENGIYPFVLTGQTIDRMLYDFIHRYLAEPGSDGVVRVAGANMNYRMIRLVETAESVKAKHGPVNLEANLLLPDGPPAVPAPTPLGVVPGASHSGDAKGIMGSVISSRSGKPQIGEILECLKVSDPEGYARRGGELAELTRATQGSRYRYSMLVFRVIDDQGDPVEDYDLFLLGTDEYDPNRLSPDFFVDRQSNEAHPNHTVFYVNFDVITRNKLTGFRVVPRPDHGFTWYAPVQFQSEGVDLNGALRPNETFYVDIVLRRRIDKNVFRMDRADEHKLERKKLRPLQKWSRRSFKNTEPEGEEI